MNHIYKTVYNASLGTWVAVSELAKGKSKNSSKAQTVMANTLKDWSSATLLATGLLFSVSASALPTGNQLVAGQATVTLPTATQMQINQTTQRAAIDWQGFSVAQNEAVNIQQPNAQAALLNRVVGQNASQIQGRINANGQVYLVNPNGVVFSKTAQVDVGGLVATTHSISNQDFLAGKDHFTKNGTVGTVENHGTINTSNKGVVALIGEKVVNTGKINTPQGTAALAAGNTVDLDFTGDGLVEVKVSEAALKAQIDNHGAIQADGGRVVMTTKAAGQLMNTVINNTGVVKAQGLVQRNGEIILASDLVSQTGNLDASGQTGGKVDVQARAILDAGETNVDGTAGKGGQVTMKASDAIIQTAAANTHANGTTTGGTVHLEAANSTYSSGKLSAKGAQGGNVNVLSNNRVVLAAADIDASGSSQGGTVRIGGDIKDASSPVVSAKTTIVNNTSKIKANGGQGKVAVASTERTEYYGSTSADKKGQIEVSSKGILTYNGSADAGVGGSLLISTQNALIQENSSLASYDLLDPHLAAGNAFGANTVLLGNTVGNVFTENGNIVVTSQGDDFAANNSGAVYLFNTNTGGLLAMLTGTTDNDAVGSSVTALTNGNYVVASTNWDNATITDAGAATWGNGTTGVSGIISTVNSLVGSAASDQVGSSGVTALTNGNYVIASTNWDNGTITNTGAATWGNGTAGVTGVITSTNSLIGSSVSDQVGSNGVTALTNGNYVVASANWDNACINDVGAVTWGSGTAGVTGVITSTNSLVGSSISDQVGSNRVTALTNGNYVVASPNWSNEAIVDAGAATWGNGTAGVTGVITSINSLVGSTDSDQVGSSGVTALTNSNYIVTSPNWDNGTIVDVGAATWGNGTIGITGVITSTNSLVGSTASDQVGSSGVTALTNGNYVVASANWDNGTIIEAGAATWGNGTIGISGVVSSTNSLVGSTENDNIGNNILYTLASFPPMFYGFTSVTALTNGHYIVSSADWDNGSITDAGSVTWGNGTLGVSGIVSSNTSLVGTQANDRVGTDITALSNGNYVIGSPYWDNGSITDAGSVTWGNGTTGIFGIITSTNSLIGSSINDRVGDYQSIGILSIAALPNGNYVVTSPYWDNGSITDAGSVTWGNGTTGIFGIITSTNSLIGTSLDDTIGSGLYNGPTILKNGDYVMVSPYWNNGSLNNTGAITWGNGSTGTTGIIDSSNSLMGSTPSSSILSNGLFSSSIRGLSNGSYVVSTRKWENAGLVDAGRIIIVTPQATASINNTEQSLINPTSIAETLAKGTNTTIKANNDITLGSDLIVNASNVSTLTLQTGRNIDLNARITTANANFTAIAGDPSVDVSNRQPGTPTITLGLNAKIDASTGNVVLAAVDGDFINNSGSTTPIKAKQWWIYSTDPRRNERNGMLADFKHYDQPYTGTTPDYAKVGNWFLYSITPTLTVTPGTQIITVGQKIKDFVLNFSGFIDGDTVDTAGISGTAILGIEKLFGRGIFGVYDVSYLRGLASKLGYRFVDNTASMDELLVLPRFFGFDHDDDHDEHHHHHHHRHFGFNIFNIHFWLTQLNPLQVHTTFNYWHYPKHSHYSDYVDVDYGQYQGDDSSLPSIIIYTSNKAHGRGHWYKKHHHKHKHHKHHKRHNYYVNLRGVYDTLLFMLKNGGIKLPEGVLKFIPYEEETFVSSTDSRSSTEQTSTSQSTQTN